MSDHRHSTDRVDGQMLAECPNKENADDDHLIVTVDYEDAADNDLPAEFIEAFPACGECGADLNVLAQERAAEVLD